MLQKLVPSKLSLTSSAHAWAETSAQKEDDRLYSLFGLCEDGVDVLFKRQAAREAYMQWANAKSSADVSLVTLARMDAWMTIGLAPMEDIFAERGGETSKS